MWRWVQNTLISRCKQLGFGWRTQELGVYRSFTLSFFMITQNLDTRHRIKSPKFFSRRLPLKFGKIQRLNLHLRFPRPQKEWIQINFRFQYLFFIPQTCGTDVSWSCHPVLTPLLPDLILLTTYVALTPGASFRFNFYSSNRSFLAFLIFNLFDFNLRFSNHS